MGPFSKTSIQILFGKFLVDSFNNNKLQVVDDDLNIPKEELLKWLEDNEFAKKSLGSLRDHYTGVKDISTVRGVTIEFYKDVISHILTDINVQRERADLQPLEIFHKRNSSSEGGE